MGPASGEGCSWGTEVKIWSGRSEPASDRSEQRRSWLSFKFLIIFSLDSVCLLPLATTVTFPQAVDMFFQFVPFFHKLRTGEI